MTFQNDEIIDSIHQIEDLLSHRDVLHDMECYALEKVCDLLKHIDDQNVSDKKNEIQQLISFLNGFEINLLCHFIKRYSSMIPMKMLTTIFDIIRLKIYINIKNYPSLAGYYIDFSLTYLIADSTIVYLTEQNHMLGDIDEQFLHLFSSICSRSIYENKSTSSSVYAAHNNVPTFFQFNDSTERLLKAFVHYLNNYFLHSWQERQSYISIFKWLINMTDIYGYIPYFVNTGYSDAISQWMSITRGQFQHVSLKLWSLNLTLLHNLARHSMGVNALNKLKMIDILKQWKDTYTTLYSITDCNAVDKNILIDYYLIYSALLEPKELKKESISDIRRVLDNILEGTVKAFNSADLTFDSYNVCEYLDGLAQFVVNDTFLIHIISYENIYELFLDKFLLFNAVCELTALNAIICASLYRIFWSISFQPDYSAKLKSNDKFLSLVEQRAKHQSTDENAVVMRQAAKGILFNLDCKQFDLLLVDDNHNSDDNQIKVMISYAHKDTSFCKKLAAKMQELFQGDIWVDFNKLSPPYEDDWEEIAKAISQCDVILMIVTENYCSSKSCRREVIHADKRNKRMIPIYQGKNYKADDWFEIRVGSATWVRFGDKKNDEEVMETLLGLINVRDKSKRNDKQLVTTNQSHFHKNLETNSSNMINTQTYETLSPITSRVIVEGLDTQSPAAPTISNLVPNYPIEQWTCEEIQQFLHLSSSILQLSSGQALLAYMNLLSHDDAQYDEYEHRMRHHGISREQFSNLISSFTSLSSLNKTKTISNKLPVQWTRDDIRYWFEQNKLSNDLLNTFDFVDGSQLIRYGNLIIHSSLRTDEEYARLKKHIGNDRFHLDEYARFLNGLEKLVNQSKEETISCNIL